MAKQAKRQLAGSGEALPAGVIGERISASIATVISPGAATWRTVGTITLTTPGLYVFFGVIGASMTTGPAQVTFGYGLTTNAAPNIAECTHFVQNNLTSAQGYVIPTTYYNVTAATTVYIVGYRWTTNEPIGNGPAYAYAVRIA